MRAILSGQAGVAILAEGESLSILRVGQAKAQPCQPVDLLWLLADATDVVELERDDLEGVSDELKMLWMSDRALQSALILLDRDERPEIRGSAATLLNASLEQPAISDFILNRLYSHRQIERADFDGALRQTESTSKNIRSLLVEVREHQGAIRVSREEWDNVPAGLFETKGDERSSEASRRGKEILEAVLVAEGGFRRFAQAIWRGVRPDEDSEFRRCLGPAELSDFGSTAGAIIQRWVEATFPAGRAMLQVHLLPQVELVRIRYFAGTLVNSLGERALERGAARLIDEAAKKIARNVSAHTLDFGQRLLTAVQEVAHDWLKEAGKDSPSLLNIWDAVEKLPRADLNRLRSFARVKVKEVGGKAHGRDAEDLLAEAITSTANGQRTWREGIDLRQHLYGAIRSIASSWREKIGEEYAETDLVGPGNPSPLEQVADEINPERILQAKQRLDQIRRLFDKDPEAQRILRLMEDELRPQEIRDRLGFEPDQYAAAVRRIRRKLEAYV
jgi:DNA-directed RNA polymerase specialized sigma24 family protein/DNA-binding transcriptional MerR regulator